MSEGIIELHPCVEVQAEVTEVKCSCGKDLTYYADTDGCIEVTILVDGHKCTDEDA